MLEHERFDLLMTDLHMPDVSGQELMVAARKLKRRGGPIPVLAVSADVMSHRPDEYVAMGFAGFLAKPLMFGMLADVVRPEGRPRLGGPTRARPCQGLSRPR